MEKLGEFSRLDPGGEHEKLGELVVARQKGPVAGGK